MPGAAGKALEVIARLEAVDGTPWEGAVMAEMAQQVMRLPAAVEMTEGARSDVSRARFLLRLSAREIGDVLKGDDRMRRAACGETARDARMTRGGGGSATVMGDKRGGYGMADGHHVKGFGDVAVGARLEVWLGEVVEDMKCDDYGEVTQLLPDRWVRVLWHMEGQKFDHELDEITDLLVPEWSPEVQALIDRAQDLKEGRGGTA